MKHAHQFLPSEGCSWKCVCGDAFISCICGECVERFRCKCRGFWQLGSFVHAESCTKKQRAAFINTLNTHGYTVKEKT